MRGLSRIVTPRDVRNDSLQQRSAQPPRRIDNERNHADYFLQRK